MNMMAPSHPATEYKNMECSFEGKKQPGFLLKDKKVTAIPVFVLHFNQGKRMIIG